MPPTYLLRTRKYLHPHYESNARCCRKRIASLEGGVAALLLIRSAATAFAVLNVATAGDHIVSSKYLYGDL